MVNLSSSLTNKMGSQQSSDVKAIFDKQDEAIVKKALDKCLIDCYPTEKYYTESAYLNCMKRCYRSLQYNIEHQNDYEIKQ
jgi:hypothetical protein